ncbi:class I SAM-dependent RNA methyltransferase [Pseudooceanicola nanhaiensis]|uniref:class I SAM-dependent RNA methyltransferase n=1 Tax=Pseudooceanicola nanhaiensis TaxID=375761 RepID=UPI001CD330BF|nr:class I SAM-dependent RNA methyltransferase [Pseudooceanicola nanhaiensis]MCA0920301.1 class I SAM-dependent RNA methyltransferase [Pseudooceanicola nanhaiensis]
MDPVIIDRLGHQGDGIAPGPLFAPLTLPGEAVTGTVSGDRLTDVRIVTPSPDRVAAPCRHYRSCGGCSLQHASDAFVANWKVEVVRRALLAQHIEAEFLPIETSPAASRRRAALSVRRTKKGALAGFHARASDVIADVPDCQLLDPRLMPALKVAEELAIAGGSRKGELSVLATISETGLDLAVTGGKPLSGAEEGRLRIDLARIAEERGLSRLAWDDEVVALRLPPTQRFDGIAVVPPPGAFLQATPQGEAALLAAVKGIVGKAGRVVDLFAGCGTFGLPLARGAEVHGVEGAAPMTRAMDHGWRHGTGLKKVTGETRDLFRNPLIADDLKRFDAAVIDPPRAGAEAQVAELAAARVPVIAHVSCNPVTFAREARELLAVGYEMGPVQVVDQFRWSPHVELVAGFSLNSA